MPTELSWRERALVMLLAAVGLAFPLVRTTALFSMQTPADAQFAAGSLPLQIIFGSIFTAAAVLLWRHGHASARLLPRINPFLFLMIAWCACTMLWSPYPVTTLKRVVQLVGLVLTALALSLPSTHAADFRRAVLAALTGLLVLSLLTVLLLPAIGVDTERGYAWRGLFWHKNTLGAAAGICLLLWLDALTLRLAPARIALAFMSLALLMLVMSKSTTALLAAVMGCGLYMLAHRRRIVESHLPAIVLLAAAIAALACLHVFYVVHGRLPQPDEILGPAAGLVGKSPDITGRADLWALVMLEVGRHPLQGMGYGAFWLNIGSPSQYIIDAVGWIPLQAHNGYLDILNELGLVGAGLLAALILFHVRTLLRLTALDRAEAALHWSLLAVILASNLSESQLFNGVLFQNTLFIFSVVMCSVRLHRLRAGRTKPMPAAEKAAP